MLSGRLILTTHQAGDGCGIGVNQFAQHMDAQVTRCTGKEDIAELLRFALQERRNVVALQDGINA